MDLESLRLLVAEFAGPLVLIGLSVLVFWPLLWLGLFGGDHVQPAPRRWIVIAVPTLAILLALGPSLWQTAAVYGSFDGLLFVRWALIFVGLPLLLVCCAVGAVYAAIAWFVAGRAHRTRPERRVLATRVGVLVGLGIFVPTASIVLWYATAIGQAG